MTPRTFMTIRNSRLLWGAALLAAFCAGFGVARLVPPMESAAHVEPDDHGDHERQDGETSAGLVVLTARQIEASGIGIVAVVSGVAANVGGQGGSAVLIRARPLTGVLPPAGSPVTGIVVTDRREDGLTVPADAVQTVDGRSVVFVASGEGFRATPVLAGRRAGGHIEILDGLDGSERIVGSNAFLLKAELAKGEAGHDH